LSGDFFYNAVTRLELMLALGKSGHSNARQQHTYTIKPAAHLHNPTTFVRPRYCVVGHVAFLLGFCPLTLIVIFVSGMHVYVHIYIAGLA